ncbi:MAG: 5'-3' exonuclease H3TH domain-containing protein, partial [Pseudomonadota bacterium]
MARYSSIVSPSRLIILDGSGYVYRAFYALQQQREGGRRIQLSTAAGMPTGALHVFTGMLVRLYTEEQPELCAVVFDAGGPTFRHQIDPAYKANRREMPAELLPQLPWFEKIVNAFRLPVIRIEGIEADDVIATLVGKAREASLEVAIYSGDKDLMQLVDDHVVVVDAMKDIVYDAAKVTAKFGVPPRCLGDWLALRGDSSDNIPGVEGIGDVTAAKLLNEYGSIDGILAHVQQLKAKLASRLSDPVQLERLQRSRQLVKLRDDVPIEHSIESLQRREWDATELVEVFRTLELNRYLERCELAFNSGSQPPCEGAERQGGAPSRSPRWGGGEGSQPPLDRHSYRTICDEEALEKLLAACRQSGELAIDTEATGLQVASAHLVGISIATPGHVPSYIPIGHRYLGAPRQLGAEIVLGLLKPILEDPAIAKYCQNHKLEWAMFARHGIELTGVRCDPMIASFLLDPTQVSHGLDELARVHLGHETIKYEEVCGKGKDRRTFDSVDVLAATRYAAEDADVTLALARRLRPRLEEAGLASILDDVEIPLARVLA